MYISRFQLENYKSFREPAPVEFTSGFNIIAGQNNAGKTALLEALGLVFKWNPHRSLRTIPARDTAPGQLTWADVTFTISPNELKELMLSSPGAIYCLPKPDLQSPFAHRIGFTDDSHQSFERLVKAVFSSDSLAFKVRFQTGPGQQTPSVFPIAQPSFDLYPPQGPAAGWSSVGFQVLAGGKLKVVETQQTITDIGIQLAHILRNHVYRFTAERMNVGRGSHGTNTVLAANASNLPEVLNQLQHNVFRFRDLNSQLSKVLPQVRQVSVRPISSTEVEIVIWSHDPASAREDLAVPLSECGTGIGQVLAILYVVMTSERPQSISIDEPQSFLHPGAARKLIEFLKLYPQHQYIIATHSATIISAASPRTITLVRFEETETRVEQLDAKAEKNAQVVLGELGIRLSDSFGADNILWVEGRTEEKCFALIVEKILRQPLAGTEILGIRQTGDLEGRDARKVFEIYRSLTKGASLLPAAIAFILDEECRNDALKSELFRLSGDLAIFLPRRMYENYLLNPAAIAEVANAIEGFRANTVTAEEVSKAINARLGDPGYFCAADKMKTLADRARNVDGGRVLEELFSDLSETRVTYQKVLHGIALTEWLIRNAPRDLDEIVQLLSRVLKTGQASDSTATDRMKPSTGSKPTPIQADTALAGG